MENFIKLGLQEIAGIMGTLGRTTNIETFNKEYEVDGITYSCIKDGNNLVITSSDGRAMSIGINAYTIADDKNPNIKYAHHEVNIDYYLSNGERINLFNDIGLYEGYDQYENVERHDLMKGLVLTYIDKYCRKVATFNLDTNRIDLPNHKTFEFTPEGIKYGNKTLSLNGKKLILIGNEKASSKEEAERFDIEDERKMIDSFINEYDLHEYSKEVLRDAYTNLDRKDCYAKEITRFYNEDLKDVRRAINVRNKINKAFDNDIITNDALYPISFNFHKDAMGIAKKL